MINTAQNEQEIAVDAASFSTEELDSLTSGPELKPDVWVKLVRHAVCNHDTAWQVRDELMKVLKNSNFKYHSIFVCSSDGNGGMGLSTDGKWQYAYVTHNGWHYRAFLAY